MSNPITPKETAAAVASCDGRDVVPIRQFPSPEKDRDHDSLHDHDA